MEIAVRKFNDVVKESGKRSLGVYELPWNTILIFRRW